MKTLLVLMAAAFTLLAADVTGTWTGQLTPDGKETGPAHLVLKQDGDKVTGTAGPDAAQQQEISGGKADKGKVSFEIQGENSVMKFTLTQEGDHMKGEVSRQADGGSETAKLDVTRAK